MTEPKKRDADPRPVVQLKPNSYQPSKAELEEPITFPEGATVDDLARAVTTPVRVVREED